MLRPRGRPKSISNDSGIDFGFILASFFHQKSYFFENRQQHENLEKQMKNQLFCTLKLPISASIFDQNFMLVPNAFQNLFFSPFGRPWAPKSRRIEFFGLFLAPLGFWGVPKIGQNRPSSAKKLNKSGVGTPRDRSWKRPASKIAFGTLLGTISSDFWWILIPFSRIFVDF